MWEWTCYTEFGCPSGHAMLGLVLIEFIIHYFMGRFQKKIIIKVLLIVAGICLEILVAFSRVYLGMHSINQVLFGIMLGVYFLVLYYSYM
jgi:sphingosine-1-phosphate phosphatase 1